MISSFTALLPERGNDRPILSWNEARFQKGVYEVMPYEDMEEDGNEFVVVLNAGGNLAISITEYYMHDVGEYKQTIYLVDEPDDSELQLRLTDLELTLTFAND